MTTDKLPTAIWEGTFTLFGVQLRCVVLDNGQRVINAEDVHRLFLAQSTEERQYPPGDIEAFAKWQRGQ